LSDDRDFVVDKARPVALAELALVDDRRLRVFVRELGARSLGHRGGVGRPLGRTRLFFGERIEQQIGFEVEVAAECLADGARRTARPGAGAARGFAAATIARVAHRTPIPSFSRSAR
jgi:hypothetical protein